MRYEIVRSFFTTINPGDIGPLGILRVCDVILRFGRISFNIPQDFMHMPR